MEFMVFPLGRIDNLGSFFKDEEERDRFISSLNDETKDYIVKHADEFHCKEQLEIVASQMGQKEE